MSEQLHGPWTPATVWTTDAVQTARKEQLLAEEGWEVLFQGRFNPDSIRLFVNRNAGSPGELAGITAMRFMDATIGYVAPKMRPSGLLYSGQWAEYTGERSMAELILPEHILVGEPLDNHFGIREIRSNFPSPEPPVDPANTIGAYRAQREAN